jgi:hypothetical protein
MKTSKALLLVSCLGLAGCGGSYGSALVPMTLLQSGLQATSTGAAWGAQQALAKEDECDVIGRSSLECEEGVEMAARMRATDQPDPRYDAIASAVDRCNQGLYPEPPFHEDECKDLIALKLEIDTRAAELEASGKLAKVKGPGQG